MLDARNGAPAVELHSSLAKRDLKWDENEKNIKVCSSKKETTAIAMIEGKGFACDLSMLNKLLSDEKGDMNNKDEDNNNTMEDIELYDFDNIICGACGGLFCKIFSSAPAAGCF